MKGDEARRFAAGMDAYLSKPIQRDELFNVVDRYLGLDRPRFSPGLIGIFDPEAGRERMLPCHGEIEDPCC
jgi:hypothetical protein